MRTNKGLFVTIEGGEGCGKSTQLSKLSKYSEDNNLGFLFTREPGGTEISEAIRKIILNNDYKMMNPKTEALLYAASRVQLIDEFIRPNVEKGRTIICDRYIMSSFAYQAYARGLGMDYISSINEYAVNGCMPDLTIFLDIDPKDAFARKGGADKDDRIEQSGMDFHKRVYEGYKALSKTYSDKFVCIDAYGGVDEVFESILKTLKSFEVI